MVDSRDTDAAGVVDVIVVGASFRTSTLALRDRLFVEDSQIEQVLNQLSGAGISQAIVLSTCDRVEVHAVHHNKDVARDAILEVLANHAREDLSVLMEQTCTLVQEDALRHMMRVASSLDSQIIGEPQVLGQVKAAHRIARTLGWVGDDLEAVMRAVYATAKRVRTETKIGEFPVSIAAAASHLAGNIHGDLAQCRVLLLGDGDMGKLVAQYLVNAGARQLTVSHPTDRRAENLAISLDCHRVPWSQLAHALVEAEIVITAVGSRAFSLNADMMMAMVKARHRKLTFAVDLAFPGDIDPATNRIDEVFLYTLAELEHVASEGLSRREAEVNRGALIIEDRIAGFLRDNAARTAVPALVKLRTHVDCIRQQALADAGGDAEKATNLLANRLLHDPTVMLRDMAAGHDREQLRTVERVLERMFQLHWQHTEDDADGE